MRYRIREARIRCGMTKIEASKLIGIHRKTLAKWEDCGFKADSELLCKLARIYKTSVDSLIPFEVREKQGNKIHIELTDITFHKVKNF